MLRGSCRVTCARALRYTHRHESQMVPGLFPRSAALVRMDAGHDGSVAALAAGRYTAYAAAATDLARSIAEAVLFAVQRSLGRATAEITRGAARRIAFAAAVCATVEAECRADVGG